MILYSTTLYRQDARGNMRQWSIHAHSDYALEINSGLVNGEYVTKYHFIFENQSGRGIDEQMELEYNSRINAKLDQGYRYSKHEAADNRLNKVQLPRPMLAHEFKNARPIFDANSFVQRKYDGNRCLVAKRNGEFFAYTRNGKEVKVIDHILDGLDCPDNTILDGELYAHGYTLQQIASWIKRKQPDSKKLRYHIYDVVKPIPFVGRLEFIKNNVSVGHHAEFVQTIPCDSAEMAKYLMREFIREGYEGAILRYGNCGYEDGKRSKSLLKLKEWSDAEFQVIGVEPSKDGWGILVMLYQGKRFKATAPGTHAEKERVWRHKEDYIGRFVTIKYAGITEDGVPFHPIAKCWRGK